MKRIDELEKDTKEREAAYIRARKKTQDFEDEVYETEILYKGINDVKNRNGSLEEELKQKTDEIHKHIRDLESLQEVNAEMLGTIRTLEMNNITYSNEVVSLKNTLTHLQSSKKNPIRELTSSTTKVSERKKLAFINTPSHSYIRKKILIVSTVHGKGMAEAMSKITEEYSILSFVKPHATDAELVVMATNLARDFTKDDVSINMAKPSHKLNGNINQFIYENNLLINKKLHATNQCLFLECNNILRRSNYYGDGIRLTNAAKFFLGKALLSSVKGLPTSGNCESEQPEFKNNQIYRGVFPDFFLINEGTAGTTTSSVPSEAEVEETSKTKLKKMAFSIPKESSSGVSPSDTSFLGEKNRSVIIT
ncbi:hypothetical protein JTB14_037123 [Gonioctena quinquepunctata]|nr:hypothetical protein JTB14_037123 [Gonioctena quinquepunctata]